jgi:NRPS condensation-like uncharacterized protein
VNDFQQLMRQWTALAPYNAGHIMRVSGAPDLERWHAAFTPVLKTLGLTEPILIKLSTLGLDQQVIQELNCPFVPGTLPLRAFVVVDQRDNHLIGVIYDHWFADSPSLRALMQRVFVHYSGKDENLPSLRLAGDDEDALEHSRFRLRALVSCLRDYLRHRRACRIHLRDPLDFDAGFFSIHFPDGAIDHIRAYAKKYEATVNDVFLATASQALGKFTAEQRKSEPAPRAKRDRVALATAVDLKPQAARNPDDFGFFVGYFTVVHDRPEAQPLPQLVAATALETSASKSAAHALEFTWGLRIARWIWDRSSRPRFKAQFFQKGLPFVAGISNVNLTGSWADQEKMPAIGEARVLDYLRVSPVGPLVPLVFTFTTIRDHLSLCVTYRTTAFSQTQAEEITTELAERLQNLRPG